jgi:plasmid stabilization system protein ParE
MNAPFQFTPQATEDLDAIWWFIAERSRDAADRVEMEIVATCRRLAKHPLIGTQRQDITPLMKYLHSRSKARSTMSARSFPTLRCSSIMCITLIR